MNLNVKTKTQTVYATIMCSLLFVKNLLYTKKLTVKNFLYADKLVVPGNKTELNWETKGCYKISIKNLGILPGNVSHLNLILNNRINPLEITFHGIGGQKEIKKIEIETSSLFALNNLTPTMSIPSFTTTLFIKEDLEKVLVKSYNYRDPKRIKLPNPKIVPQNLKLSFDPFIKSN